EGYASAYAVVVQPDGKVVLGGEAEQAGRGVLALARLHPDGTLDAGFGAGGVVTTSGGGDLDAVWQLRLQPDGKIVAAGWATDGVTFQMRFMVARFLGTPVVEGPRYEFSGFFRPVTDAPALNVVKAGRVVPVKFSLGGDQGLSIFPTDGSGQAMYPASVPISCTTLAPDPAASPVTTSQRLAYDEAADQYVYAWKTLKAWAGTCRQLTIELNDGTAHTANFNFSK
ncbi:MAG: PxKF domain-containing protein, partial [Candidatus Rokubacteria bacterium]|nr:PxKF domain-containing protein [Candidatus Rokubacteria bacterium]